MPKPKLIRVALKYDKTNETWKLKLSQGGRVIASGEYDSLAHAHEACLRLYQDAHAALHKLCSTDNLK